MKCSISKWQTRWCVPFFYWPNLTEAVMHEENIINTFFLSLFHFISYACILQKSCFAAWMTVSAGKKGRKIKECVYFGHWRHFDCLRPHSPEFTQHLDTARQRINQSVNDKWKEEIFGRYSCPFQQWNEYLCSWDVGLEWLAILCQSHWLPSTMISELWCDTNVIICRESSKL